MIVEVRQGEALFENKTLRWGGASVTLEPNDSWFRSRTDLITAHPDLGICVHKGRGRVFNATGQVPLALVRVPSRFEAFGARVWLRASAAFMSLATHWVWTLFKGVE